LKVQTVVNIQPFPERIQTEQQLDEVLTCPSSALIEFVKDLGGTLLVLGAGGKMGPTLAVLAKRAAEATAHPLKVIAVSRFGNAAARAWLESNQISTVGCDLLDPRALPALPDAANIIYLVGQKFGTTQDPASTWAMNTIVPLRVLERYPQSRIVALSTGNVYPPSEVKRGGSLETDPLTPLGEYANATVGRERIFEFMSQRQGTRVVLLRLFYAVELRYGVLVDLALKILHEQPLDLCNGYFNCIWQGDANELTLRSLALATSPPVVWNLCHPELFSVRAIAARFGQLLGKSPRFIGAEAPTALLGNSSRLCSRLGTPAVSLELMMHWIADWVKGGGRNLGRPTHFEVRDGKY
jgi:nucleoside-diphosphate-sugar epimerase